MKEYLDAPNRKCLATPDIINSKTYIYIYIYGGVYYILFRLRFNIQTYIHYLD